MTDPDRPFRDEPTEVLRAAHGLAATHARHAARFNPDADSPQSAAADLFRDELQHRGEL
ncbi:hypothetical protein ABIE67_007881 [Streptomyces sp. V4I8]|uniref:hypothetical protein n=1 Tax=Streptomyces sp. V4I8 TaxID=3156469 RepID=UPI0035167489